LSNHLGNVLVTISDKKIPVASTTNPNLIAYYKADVVTANDYFPFGMSMPGRKYTQANSSYRYGFQGQEQDKEFYDGAISYLYRVEDPRIGRFLSVDPLASQFAYYSPYSFSGNRVLDSYELEGLEPENVHSENGINGVGKFDNKSLSHRGEIKDRFGKKGKQFTTQDIFDEDGVKIGNLVKRMIPVGDIANHGQKVEGYQEAFVVTDAKMDYFIKNSDKYYDISRNYELYNILWGEMDRNPPALGLLDPRYYLAGRVLGAIGGASFKMLGAYGKAAGLIFKETTVIEELMLAANSKRPGGSYSVAADHLLKHSDREGSIFNLEKGKMAIVNAKADKIIREIITHPEAVVTVRPHNNYGEVIDVRTPKGGVLFSGDGKQFIGLRENSPKR
jgi:RHS repeat-associated protein